MTLHPGERSAPSVLDAALIKLLTLAEMRSEQELVHLCVAMLPYIA